MSTFAEALDTKKSQPIANPGPLGKIQITLSKNIFIFFINFRLLKKIPSFLIIALSSFAMNTFFYSMYLVLAGMWEMKRGDTFHATVFSSYGKFLNFFT